MVLPDVSVLAYVFRPEVDGHAEHRAFMQSRVEGDAAFGRSSIVLSGFLRVVTHPRIFATPDPMSEARVFTETRFHCEADHIPQRIRGNSFR